MPRQRLQFLWFIRAARQDNTFPHTSAVICGKDGCTWGFAETPLHCHVPEDWVPGSGTAALLHGCLVVNSSSSLPPGHATCLDPALPVFPVSLYFQNQADPFGTDPPPFPAALAATGAPWYMISFYSRSPFIFLVVVWFRQPKRSIAGSAIIRLRKCASEQTVGLSIFTEIVPWAT